MQSAFSANRTDDLIILTFLELTDQITRSRCLEVNIISAGTARWPFKSTIMLQSVQPSNNKEFPYLEK